MGKSAPQPPDPAETAGAQTANNIGTSIANQVMGSVNQITPTGSLTYYFNGPNGELIAPGDYSPGTPMAQPQQTAHPVQQPSAPEQSYLSGADRRDAQMLGTTPGMQTQGQSQPQQQTTNTGTGGGFQWTDPNTGNVYTIPQMTAVQALSESEQGIFDASQGTRQNLADLGNMVSGQMQDHFANPFSLDGLPQGGSASNINTPNYQQLTGLQSLNTGFDAAGPINTSVNSRAGELTRDFGTASISGGIADAGEILREFGEAGDITRTYGTDFSEDRRRVEEALMSRLNPSLDRDREGLRTSLINQGIREGSEAFDRAMNRANEQSTDARMQAILAGGQEQSRLADLEARRAGFENAAQQQAYNQALGRGQFSNNAQQQQFGQNRDSAALSLQAQIAQEQANFQRMQAGNNATQAAFGMDLSAAGFGNQAQQQQFGQNMATANFGNQAVMGNNALQFDAANFGNNLQDRGFQNDAFMQERMDADRSRALQEMLMARNQPINEIGALLGTGQVQMPNFVNTNAPQIPTVDRAGLENQAYSQELAAWQQQQQTLGSIFGTAGQIASGGLSGGYF